MAKKKTEFDVARLQNNWTYMEYYYRLKLLAMSIFHWKNLDYWCGHGAEIATERALFERGKAVFINDKELGLLALNADPCNKYNVYGLPINISAWSIGYPAKIYNLNDVVFFKNNDESLPTSQFIEQFAYRLYEVTRTTDVNIQAQKTPVLIEGDDKTILTLKNVYMQYNGNIPVVFGNRQHDIGSNINVLKTDAPFLANELSQYKKQLWNEALTTLGVDNNDEYKKERQITGEIQNNKMLIYRYLNMWYKNRKDACDRFNELFDIPEDKKVEITLNEQLLDIVNDAEKFMLSGMDGNEDFKNTDEELDNEEESDGKVNE